ncbi:hypothetical protein DUI87_02162 [Hirundo rustica rustica]|uniref:Uncharacterized protein n=1 Tax=Hirundo rustica rustica TaxID=333673 RepID=A0A3M0L872_HIRRU|nr:hypothetical protein DUI87_02162 [Hirundo rustica rustica]
MGQDHICLSATSADSPLSTCLVGIPFKPQDFPPKFLQIVREINFKAAREGLSSFKNPHLNFDVMGKLIFPVENPFALWPQYLYTLSPLSSPLNEIELLGSANASLCVRFEFYLPRGQERLYPKVHPASFRSNSWCREMVKLKRPTTWDNKPWALPKGVFFICGDRAWAGIPPHHVGGPCTLGKLSLLSPNKTTLINWHNKISTHSAIQKRDLRALNPDCDSEIVHWAKTKGVAVTIFLPWVSIAKALGELAHLECWVAKQANLTSDALANLLSDKEITRQATLQNWAAIDYLLLLHGHWCEEFEGLCCFNLSSKAEDVHTAIRQMQDMVTNIKRETDDWLSRLFTNWGISGWVSSIIKTVLLCLFVLLLIMLTFGLLKRMLYNLISATTHSPSVNHVIAPTEESPEEEGLELEEVLEGAPEDGGRDPDEEEHGLGYPTQHH